MMRVLKPIVKIVVLPVDVAVTLVKWVMVFLVGFSSPLLNKLAGFILLVAVLSYMTGSDAGTLALELGLIGFVVFMIPVAGEAVVTAIAALSARIRAFLRS